MLSEPRRKWCSLLFSRDDDIGCSWLFDRFARICWPLAETKRTDGGLEFSVDDDVGGGGGGTGSGLDIFGGAVNVAGVDVWYREGTKENR